MDVKIGSEMGKKKESANQKKGHRHRIKPLYMVYEHRMPICVSGGSTCNDDRGDVLQPVEGCSYVHHLEHINPDPEYTSPPPNPILLVLPIRYNLPTQRTDRGLVLYVPGGRSDLTRPGVYLMSTKRFFRYTWAVYPMSMR